MAETDIKGFSAWKFEWINALMIGVDHREFKVAVCLLQHASKETKLIKPSQERIAVLLGCTSKTVERATSKLVKSRVLEKVRQNRQSTNQYRFLEPWRDVMTDVRTQREDEWREIRGSRIVTPDPTDVSAQKQSDPTDVSAPEQTDVSVPDPTDVGGKHLPLTPAAHHLLSSGIEEEDLSSTTVIVDGHEQASPQAKALPHDLAAAFDKIDPSKRDQPVNESQRRNGTPTQPPRSYSPAPSTAKAPRTGFNGKPYVPPNFDHLEKR